MKPIWKVLIVFLLAAAIVNIIFLVKSNNDTIHDKAAEEKQYEPDIKYRVSLEYATACINNYKEKFLKDSIVIYFTIDRQDLFQTVVLDTSTQKCPIISKYDYARGYIGYDTLTHKFHIFFTPVEGVVADSLGNIINPGKEVILTGQYGNTDRQTGRSLSKNSLSDPAEGPYMLDLNAPCPTTCDPSSTPFLNKRVQ